jgi:LPXTG-motif cell wall-anchored protein
MGKTVVVRLAAAAAGGLLALGTAAPAWAQSDTTVDIKDDQVPTTAEEFGEQECDGPFEDLADDQDGWHFILTQYSGELDELALSFDFEDASGGAVQVDADPAEFVRPGQSSTVHLFLALDAGLTLVAAQASGPAEGFGNNPQFNLSHTCPGEEGPGNETPPPGGEETPPPGGGETPPPGDNGGGGEQPPGDDGSLPVTGTQVGGLVAIGAGLLAAGAAMLAVRRRRILPDADPADG